MRYNIQKAILFCFLFRLALDGLFAYKYAHGSHVIRKMVLAMKRLYRPLSALLVLLMGLSFVGCSVEKSTSTVSLTVWHYYNGDQLDAFTDLVSEFNETVGAHEGIFVEAYTKGSIDNLRTAVKDAAEHKIGADAMPNIFSAYADYAYELYNMGQLANLDEYFSEQERSKYIDAYLSEGNFAGGNSILLFPFAKSTEVLLLNITDFAPFANACNISEQDLATWEGIADTAEKYYRYTDALTSVSNDGKAFFGRDSVANYILVGCAQLGQPLMQTKDEKISINIDSSTMRRLWDNYYVPYVSGYYTSLGRFRSDDAKTGDIIALVGSSSGCSYFPSDVTRLDGSRYPITAKVLPLPNFAESESYAVQQGAGMAVTKASKQTEQAAVVFLKWLTEPEQNVRFSARTGYFPVQKAANSGSLLDSIVVDENIELLPIVKDTLKVGMDMSTHYRFFTNAVFNNSYDFRSIVENSLQAQANHDRVVITTQIEAGISRQAALEPFLSDTHFEQWLLDFEHALYQATAGK